MEYGIIRFGAGEDYVVEDVLTALAQFYPANPVKGYAVEVADHLRGGLSFIEGAAEGSGLAGKSVLPLSRIYVSFEGAGGFLLIAADSMEDRASWIGSRMIFRTGKNFSGVIQNTLPKKEWTLVGVTAPGWMILFDEDAPEAEQDVLDLELRVAYLPAEERLFHFLSPDKTSAEALSFLTEYLLSSLPQREEIE